MFFGNYSAPFLCYRTIGRTNRERYGLGFLDKANRTWDYQNRAHPAYVIVLVLNGRGFYLTDDGQKIPLEAGCSFQRYPGVIHSTRLDPASHWQEIFFEFGPTMTELLQHYGVIDYDHPVHQINLADFEFERFRMLAENFQQINELELTSLISEFIYFADKLLPSTLPTPNNDLHALEQLLNSACDLLSHRFTEKINLREFCRQSNCSYEKFRKIFKQRLGVSPHHYRILRRLDEACRLLNNHTMSISAIAAHLGYASPYEFSAQFKKFQKCAPSKYRQ